MASACVVVGAACEPATGPITRTVTDSAGVSIVHYRSAPDLPAHQLASDPQLTLGSDTVQAEVFYRISGVVRFPDGGVGVADGGSQEVRTFDRLGEHIATFGGQGQGPSEFSFLSRLDLVGRTHVAGSDAFAGAVGVFDYRGTFQEAVTFPPSPEGYGPPFSAGWISTGAWVIQRTSSGAEITEGPRRDPIRVDLYDLESDQTTTIVELPGVQAQVRVFDGRPGMVPIHHGGRPIVRAAGPRIATLVTDRPEVRIYEGARLSRIVRFDSLTHPVDVAERNRLREYRLGSASSDEDRTRIRQQFEEGLFADSLPAFSDILLDAGGWVWLERFRPEYEEGPDRWWVVDQTGQARAEVTVPEAFSPGHVDQSSITGVWRDHLGVEHVRVYGLPVGLSATGTS